MAIMTRMLRLCRADVHGVMDQLEDKELLLRQYLREMEASIDQKERQIHSLSQRHTGLSRRIDRHKKEIDKLEADLDLAIQKEKDDISRMLIRRRRMLDSACRRMQAEREAVTQEESALAATVADHRLQYDALKTQADAYCQRTSHASPATQKDSADREWAGMDPTPEEIELELLRRKEVLLKGGPQ